MTGTNIHQTTNARLIPQVPGNRFIGRMLDFQRDPLALLRSVADEYGDISQMKVMTLRVVTLRTAEAVKHVLVDNHRNYSVGINTRVMMGYWLGQGLFVAEGNRWLQSRRLMQPVFSRPAIQPYANIITEAVGTLCERWQTQAEAPFDLFEEMQQLTLSVAARVFLSVDIAAQGESAAFGNAVSEMVDFYGRWIRNAALALVPHRHMQRLPRFRRALATMDSVVTRIIEERRQRGTGSPHDDILQLLLAARDAESGAALSDQQVRDEVMTLLFAGHETTASALTWTFYLLSQHPSARRRLQQELAEVLGGRLPTLSDIPSVPYTTQVIHEALRLYPPVWGMFRVAVEEDSLLGYHVQPLDRIGVSPYVIHRNPAYWPDPERFDPGRFEAEAVAARPKYAYLPFGGGPRQCIGRHLAMLEMQLAVATIAQRFYLEPLPNQRIVPEALLTLRPRYGVKVRAKRAPADS